MTAETNAADGPTSVAATASAAAFSAEPAASATLAAPTGHFGAPNAAHGDVAAARPARAARASTPDGPPRLAAASPLGANQPGPPPIRAVVFAVAGNETSSTVPTTTVTTLTVAAGAVTLAQPLDATPSQLTALISGLTTALNGIESALESKAFLESLPIVGSQLGKAFTAGQSALHAFQTLDHDLINALEKLSTGAPLSTIATALNGAVAAAGFGGTVTVADDGSGGLAVDFANTDTASYSAALDSKFGLPGLNFGTSGSVTAGLSYGLNLSTDVSSSGTFSASPSNSALTLGVNLTAPYFNADATLGFLKFHAADAGSALTGTFDVGTSGAVTFGGNANLAVGLSTDLGSANFPGLSTTLTAGWGFSNATVNPGDQSGFGGTPTVALSNVGIDFGSYVDKFLRPFFDQLDAVIKPLMPAIDVLTQDITPLESLPDAAKDAINNLGINDGVINLLDFMKAGGGAEATLADVIAKLQQIDTIAQFFDGTSAGATPFSLGSFSLAGNIRSAGFDPATATLDAAGSYNLDSLLSGAGAIGAEVQSIDEETGFDFPILEDPLSVAQMLLGGGNVDLASYTLPEQNFGYGDVSDPSSWTTLVPLPLWPAPPVSVNVIGALDAKLGLTFGFDTSGLKAFAQGGYSDPSLIFDGLYVADPTQNGQTLPILTLGAGIGVDLQVGVQGLASVSGGLDVLGSFNVALANGGKAYLSQIGSLLTTDPGKLFDSNGRVIADLDISGEALGAKLFEFTSAPLVLYSPFADSPDGTPSQTVWQGGASGDFETSGNWSPSFVAAPIVPGAPTAGTWDVFGDATINTGAVVSFNGPTVAELYSLQLAAGSSVLAQSGTLDIDGSDADSKIAGTLDLTGQAEVQLGGVVLNTGRIVLGTAPGSSDTPLIGVAEVLDLSGHGTVISYSASAGFGQGFIPHTIASPTPYQTLLRNDDNTIEGIGLIDVKFENDGTILANTAGRFLLTGAAGDPDLNTGLIAASGASADHGTLAIEPQFGTGLGFELDNAGGTIASFGSGVVLIVGSTGVSSDSTVIRSGTLAGPSIEVTDLVTLDGGSTGLTLAGLVTTTGTAGSTLLTLTGVLNGADYAASPGTVSFASGANTIQLDAATIHGGELDASGAGGSIEVGTTATLDGSAAVGIAGTLHVDGKTLSLDGAVEAYNFGLSSGIELTKGELIVGTKLSDAATLTPFVPLLQSVDPGILTLDASGKSAIVGYDAHSVLTNAWLIVGAGALGNGSLGVTNEAAGVIEATGSGIAVNPGTLGVTNLGLMEAASSVLSLSGLIDNAGGRIVAAGNLAYVDLIGATIAGGNLATSGSGTIFFFGGGSTLDGTAAALTLDSGANIVLSTSQTLSGTIANETGLSLAYVSSTQATLDIAGVASLRGGGSIGMADALLVAANADDTLDNVDNLISGTGTLGRESSLTVTNETKGTVQAAGGLLAVWADGGVVNAGTLRAFGGTLDLRGTFGNAGGVIAASDDGAKHSAIVQLDFAVISGGMLASDTSDTASIVTVLNTATLDGATQGALTIASAGNVLVGSGRALWLLGSIVDAGSLALVGNTLGRPNDTVDLNVSGTVELSGGGSIVLSDGSGADNPTTQVITGASSADVLINAGVLISGVGDVGADAIGIVNQTDGTISAIGGTLTVAAGSSGVSNTGLMSALSGGTLDLRNNIANTGGTIAGDGGVVLLDNVTVAGGTFSGTAGGRVLGHAGTIDGTTSAVTILADSMVGVTVAAPASPVYGDELYLTGAIVNHGTLFAAGASGSVGAGTGDRLVAYNSVTLSGSGLVRMFDATAGGSGGATWFVGYAPGGGVAPVLDNVDNTIVGIGAFGPGGLVVTNETKGIVEAQGGTLFANYSGIVNRGTLEGAGGTLDLLSGTIANTGLIAALSGGSADPGVVLIDGAIIQGGTLASDLADATSILQAGTHEGTLDGTAAAVTLATGASLLIAHDTRLAVTGDIANQGTLALQADSANNQSASLEAIGHAQLTGGGVIALSDSSDTVGFPDDVIAARATTDSLDNADNTIVGVGRIGWSAMLFTNESKGIVEAQGGVIDTFLLAGSKNAGTLEAVGGTLDLNGSIDNTGGLIRALNDGAGHSGTVLLDNVAVSGGTFASDTADAASMIALTAAGSGATLDGATSVVTIGAGSQLRVDHDDNLVVDGHIADDGTIDVVDTSQIVDLSASTLAVAGTVTFDGGGAVVMQDLTGRNNDLTQQIVAARGFSSATLDNAGVTISGVGEISGLLLVNGAAGAVTASGGLLTITGGSVQNTGLLTAANGSTLELFDDSGIANAGGTIAATGGVVLLYVSTIAGGVLTSSAGGMVVGTQSTLDGTAQAVTIAAGASVGVSASIPNSYSNALTLTGTLVNHGTLFVQGNANGVLFPRGLAIAGTVRLSGGGTLAMSDLSPASGLSDFVYAVTAGATLDNIDNTISGRGTIGDSPLLLVNEANGIIATAAGGTLVFNRFGASGTTTGGVANQGTIKALGGTLDLAATFANAGGVIGAFQAGGTVLIDGATIKGGTLTTDATGVIVVSSDSGTLDGQVDAVTLAAGANLQVGVVGQNSSLTLTGTIADDSTIQLQSNAAAGHGADLTIAGTVMLTGGGGIAMSDGSGATGDHIVGNGAPATLINIDTTISGSGRIGDETALTVVNNGLFEATSATVGLTLDLDGSTLTNQADGELLGAGAGGLLLQDLALANSGTFAVGDGGTVVLRSNVTLANSAGGTLSGGTWSATAAGHGAALDLAGGAITVDAANIVLDGTGAVLAAWNGTAYQDIAASLRSVDAGGTLQLLGGRGYTTALGLADAGSIVLSGGTFQTGSLTLAAGGTLRGAGTVLGAVADSGTVQASGGLLTLVGSVTGSGTLGIGVGATLELAAGAAAAVSFADGAAGTLQLDAPAAFLGAIAGLALGDTIDFAKTAAAAPSVSGGVLSVTVAGAPVAYPVAGALAGNHFAVQSDGAGGTDLTLTAGLPCFAAGTAILTADGDVAVETLRIGSRVRTLSGALAPVRWVGQRRVACDRHPRPELVMPIRVCADAFALGQPSRDLLLSPDHAVFVGGVLIPIRCLVNGRTIVQVRVAAVTYFHVELKKHDVLFADGLACESFLDTGNRAEFANGGAVTQLHPDFARRTWDGESCAPLVVGGPQLARVRAMLRRRRPIDAVFDAPAKRTPTRVPTG